MREILHALWEDGRNSVQAGELEALITQSLQAFPIQYIIEIMVHKLYAAWGLHIIQLLKNVGSDVEHWTVSTLLKSSWNYVEISTELNVQRKFNDILVLIWLKTRWKVVELNFNVDSTLKHGWTFNGVNVTRWK